MNKCGNIKNKKEYPENDASLFEGAILGHRLYFWNWFVTCDSKKKHFTENTATELKVNGNTHLHGF